MAHLQLDRVARCQHRVDIGFGHWPLIFAQQIEQVFEHMGERRNLGKPKHRAAAFDRMGRAENRVQIIGLGRVDIHPQQD